MTIRKQLAAILSSHFDVKVNPKWLQQNYGDYWSGRNYGYAFSWVCNPDHWTSPLYGLGSCLTMTDFVRLIKSGHVVTLTGDDLTPTRNY